MNNLNSTITRAEKLTKWNPKLAELLKKLKENRELKKPVNKLVNILRTEMGKILATN
jgi:hypothetical protein